MAEGDGLDNLLNEIGMGRWQILGLVANFLIWIVLSPHTIGTTLLNAPVPFKCLPNDEIQGQSSLLLEEALMVAANPNVTFYDNVCLDSTQRGENDFNLTLLGMVNSTSAYDPEDLGHLPNCPLIKYDDSIFESTVTTEWDLICDHSLKRPLFQNTYTIGLIVGCFIGGDIGDRLGRARAVLVGSIIHTVGTLVVAFTTNFVLLLIGRFLCGLTNLMILVTVVTLSLETCPEKFRGPIGMGVGLPYSIGVIVFAGLGVFLRNWRHLYIATSFPALLLVPVAWCLDESPRWLLQVGQLEKATKIMEKAAKTNRCSFESKDKIALILQEVMQKEQKLCKKEKQAKPTSWTERIKSMSSRSFTSLKSPAMRKISIISPTVWFLNEVVYYGTIFNANRFSSNNPFLYVALTGVADGLAIMLGTVGCYFGRRMTVAGSQFISGVLLLLVLAVPDELKWLQWIFVMTGFLMCACASQALFVYTPELFPTVIRARGFAFSNSTGYTGTLVAPFIPDVLAPVAWWITNAILGSIGFISCTLVMNLPETRHVAMCETIQDVEEREISIQNKKKEKAKEDAENKAKKMEAELKAEDNIEGKEENATNSIPLSFIKGYDNPALEKDI